MNRSFPGGTAVPSVPVVRHSVLPVVLAVLVALVAVGGLAAAFPARLGATEVKTFQLQSQKAFLAGTLEGVSVDPTGRLQLADRAERVTALQEPFLLSAAAHPDGWVVGTGNEGKVLLIDHKGEVRELFSAGEGQVFAVLADPDGTVWAGVSPGGKVYRIPAGGGEASVWFDSGETYVWDLARATDGALLVATGTSGKLFRVTGGPEGGEGKVLYDSDDTHVRTLLVRDDGSVIVGTAGEGLILRVAPDGTVRTLYDADQPEVVSLAASPDGTIYAAVIASEASQVDLSSAAASAKGAKAKEAAAGGAHAGAGAGATVTPGGTGEVEVTMGPSSAGSRPAGFSGKRSQIIALSPDGATETAWAFDDETIFDLAWIRGRLWVATGLEGKLYSFDGERMVLEQDLDERQIVALLPDTPGPAFATTNAPALYRLSGERVRSGTYTSPVLDAGSVARFGTIRWRGGAPDGSGLTLSLHSGLSAEPDATWSPWTKPGQPADNGELRITGLPRGRYVQWRLEMTAPRQGVASPVVDGVELSYRQANVRPEISSFEAMDPGQVLVPAGFNPTLLVFEPAHPNRDGIFTTLEQTSASGEGRTKVLWKKGYRTFRWSAEDPNEDELVFSLEFRPLYPGETAAGGKDDGKTAWMTVADDLTDDHYSFDATVLPDGVYRFRLTASDADDNAPSEGLSSDEISEPVVVDHTPPALVEAHLEKAEKGHHGDRLRVVIEDADNPLREAEVSADAGEWQPASAADGLIDARREAIVIPLDEFADGAPRLLLLRVTDAAYNVTTFDLTDRLR